MTVRELFCQTLGYMVSKDVEIIERWVEVEIKVAREQKEILIRECVIKYDCNQQWLDCQIKVDYEYFNRVEEIYVERSKRVKKNIWVEMFETTCALRDVRKKIKG